MSETKRVIVTGATGLIGKPLCQQLAAHGYEVVVFGRDIAHAQRQVPSATNYVQWTPAENGPWTSALDGAYAVIHLAGASVFGKRWNEAYKREIRDSRVVGTRGLVNGMLAAASPPKVFVCGSAIGYYGFRDDTPLDETAAPGTDFLARICVDWEREALRAEAGGVRTVVVRTGIVLDLHEGALPQMLLPFKFFSGGPIGSGDQWVSWIHLDDIVGIFVFALEHAQVRGPINGVAPEPLRNRDFSAALGRIYGTPSWLPVPSFALGLALGEAGAMATEGQRVVPQKAQEDGYQFRFPTAAAALRDLLKK